MNTVKRITTITRTLLYAFALTAIFGACSESNDPIAGPETVPSYSVSLAKEATATAITDVDTITAILGGKLKINGREINNAEFDVRPSNVTADLIMSLVKLSETSNSYHFEPFGLDMPEGVRITLHYSHSAMPYGITEDDLKVFMLQGDQYVPLESRVQQNKMQVHAETFVTGEYALGAYDAQQNLHLIEGEFGIRYEEVINPRQGGTLRLGGGSELHIPANALDERTTIGMIATRETIRGNGGAKAFTFTPHGTVFNTPIHLVLSWKEFDGEPVEMYYFNELTQEWEISAQGVWDESNRTVTLELHHFSRYAFAWAE